MKRTLHESILFVHQAIEQEGIRVPDSCRIGAMRRACVKHEHDTVLPIDPDFSIIREGLRDIQQLEFIFDNISQAALPKDFGFRLKRLLKDHVLLQDDREGTPGRDIQCELYAAAIFAKAGLEPSFEEPDLRIELENQRFGVAIKRLKSLDKLETRTKEAANQIHRTGLPGFIVVDLMVAFNQENQAIAHLVSDRELSSTWRRMFKCFVDEYITRIREWVRGKWVHGVVFLDHVIRLQPDLEWGLDSMSFFVCLAAHNQRRINEFQLFRVKFENGLATPVNVV